MDRLHDRYLLFAPKLAEITTDQHYLGVPLSPAIVEAIRHAVAWIKTKPLILPWAGASIPIVPYDVVSMRAEARLIDGSIFQLGRIPVSDPLDPIPPAVSSFPVIDSITLQIDSDGEASIQGATEAGNQFFSPPASFPDLLLAVIDRPAGLGKI